MDIDEIKLKNPLRKKKINPVALGAAGLVVGAGVAAAITLGRNKKLQKKVKNFIGNVKGQAGELTASLKKDNNVKKTLKATKKLKSKSKTSKS